VVGYSYLGIISGVPVTQGRNDKHTQGGPERLPSC